MSDFKIIICGSRNFNNWKVFKSVADKVFRDWQWSGRFFDARSVELLHGAAQGADSLADRYGNHYGFHVTPFPAKWDDVADFIEDDHRIKYHSNGKPYNSHAGPERNQEMLDYALEHENGAGIGILAFYLGKSKGSKNMIRIAKKAGADWNIWRHEKWALQTKSGTVKGKQ